MSNHSDLRSNDLPEFISVKICRDHFTRIANRTQCQQCPSIMNNFANLRLAAPITPDIHTPLPNDIQESLQRILANQHHVIERLETDIAGIEKEMTKLGTVLMGVDGANGLRSRVAAIETQVMSIQKWIWVATGLLMAGQSLLFLLPKLLQ